MVVRAAGANWEDAMNSMSNCGRQRPSALLAICVATMLGTAGGVKAEDAAAGLVLAEKWCNACHSIGTEEARQEDAGPIWADIAARDPDVLRAALDTPHDFMPEFPTLSDADKANLVAYIRSLE